MRSLARSMLINKNVAITTTKLFLVPYCEHQVPKYHEWMKDEEIQASTASEPLTLEEEYSMQQSWRTDADKLTFITCVPFRHVGTTESISLELQSMVGDVNLFVIVNEENDSSLSLVGELELMIAEKTVQRQGLGRAALLIFLKYVLRHQEQILEEYFRKHSDMPNQEHFDYFRVKISSSNLRSINLFDSLGFTKTDSTPNVFDEFEMRHTNLSLEEVQGRMEALKLDDYSEILYSVASKEDETESSDAQIA